MCTGRPSFLSDHSMSDLENVNKQIDAINLCQSSVEFVLKHHPARMRHAAEKWDCNCAKKCSTCYGLRSAAPKKSVKPTRNTRNSNKVLMSINLESLLAANHQKNAKRNQEVVVVDSDTEKENAMESIDNDIKELTNQDASKDNETENNAMEASETEPNNKASEANKTDKTDNKDNKNNGTGTEASEPNENKVDLNETD